MDNARAAIIAPVSIERGRLMRTASLPWSDGPKSLADLPIIPWMKRSRCKNIGDPEIFFRERASVVNGTDAVRGHSVKVAKEFCNGCPVKVECLLYALENDEEFGIWGGATPDERRRIRKYYDA